jgi:hypothetical protein
MSPPRSPHGKAGPDDVHGLAGDVERLLRLRHLLDVLVGAEDDVVHQLLVGGDAEGALALARELDDAEELAVALALGGDAQAQAALPALLVDGHVEDEHVALAADHPLREGDGRLAVAAAEAIHDEVAGVAERQALLRLVGALLL